ncbi:hypothetical protein K440DRAFT_612173 [Wilcoxina mikolae CBS 423.85]|nr:hypothetical protein K440DRAFT_612173 [Wilcoxina mikolae CBS 423.85]
MTCNNLGVTHLQIRLLEYVLMYILSTIYSRYIRYHPFNTPKCASMRSKEKNVEKKSYPLYMREKKFKEKQQMQPPICPHITNGKMCMARQKNLLTRRLEKKEKSKQGGDPTH